jgi:hypothetical protein
MDTQERIPRRRAGGKGIPFQYYMILIIELCIGSESVEGRPGRENHGTITVDAPGTGKAKDPANFD